MLHIKPVSFDGVRCPNLVAHGDDFIVQQHRVSRCGDHALPDPLEALAQSFFSHDKTRACHGLVLPGPCGVAAALLLVVGIGLKTGNQQPGVAVGPQGGVDLEKVALAGFDGQPGDQFAHKGGVNLRRLLMLVFVNEHNVQIAAVAELLAA